MEIRIELSDEQMRRLGRCLREARSNSLEEAAVEFATLATTAWIDWLSGYVRYYSLTEQYADWIEDIYARLLPESEPPSTDRLYNSFNIPYGQAQYIQRMLNNKMLTKWRARAVEELKAAMEFRLHEAGEWVRTGRGDDSVEIIVSRLAYLELKSAWERLFQQDPNQVPFPKVQTAGNLCSIRIPALFFATLYDSVKP